MATGSWSPFVPGQAGRYLGEVASEAAMKAAGAARGDWVKRTDKGTAWFLTGDDPSNINAWTEMPVGKVFQEISVQSGSESRATDIIKPMESIQYVNPQAGATEGIFFASFGQSIYSSVNDVINGGHFLGVMGWGVLVSKATIAMGIGVEGRYEHNPGAGTTTQAKAVLGLVSNQGGTMINVKGLAADIQNRAGAVMTNVYGCHVEMTVNHGTVNKFVGFGMPNLTDTIPNVGTKRFFENLDPQAPAVSVAPIIEQSYGYTQAVNGGTYQLQKNISDFQLITPSGGTQSLATFTFKLPPLAQLVDGQEVCIATTGAIAAFTLDGNGVTVFNAPTALAAGQAVRYKFYGNGVNLWFKR